MSRNKIIKMVHDFTGLSYKECRALCKHHHWNKDKLTVVALSYDADTLGNLKESITNTCDGIYSAFMDAGATIAEALAIMCDNWAEALRVQSERMQAMAAQFDVNKDVFNYEETGRASILNSSEVQPPLTAHVGNVSFPIELEPSKVIKPFEDLQNKWNTPIEPLSIKEMREQFGLNPIPDVNDPQTPVFAPYYASTAGNGKLYQNDGGRNTDETGA